ncbi:ABC transporter permease [Thiohalobacter sp. IOR34]|uniref:ABC transporter permease n=1 Tax=Thiohalobacter sp. IOR34 TaxID=3057176 RepID=UPI0025B10E11|nr:ABC transporter permease [Thiohalobacter sp. IOR34]WJW76249.1 ABC transporter permease [Thiohalobacter sp. IOR34]
MSSSPQPAELQPLDDGGLRCLGDWTVAGLDGRERALLQQVAAADVVRRIDGSGIRGMDTAGAWLLHRLLRRAKGGPPLQDLPPRYAGLLELVEGLDEGGLPPPPPSPGRLAQMGKQVLDGFEELFAFLAFTGEVFQRLARQLLRPWSIRWPAVFADLETAGLRALGIVGLLSFLMGVVIAYQGAVQLRIYGANIYVADLVGLSMLRELAPLLTAIIVAGRTGSAYTAQIGTMQVTEEVAALQTIGIPPLDLLVLPKLIALSLALPLLSVFADILGVIGGMLMAQLQLGLGFEPFLDRFADAVSARSFLLGLIKAPVFAVIIALVGCFQGFRVAGSAASVGRHTTLSVVQSIFLVIVADAQFSVLFSWLGI